MTAWYCRTKMRSGGGRTPLEEGGQGRLVQSLSSISQLRSPDNLARRGQAVYNITYIGDLSCLFMSCFQPFLISTTDDFGPLANNSCLFQYDSFNPASNFHSILILIFLELFVSELHLR